jgi:hypothetical protein
MLIVLIINIKISQKKNPKIHMSYSMYQTTLSVVAMGTDSDRTTYKGLPGSPWGNYSAKVDFLQRAIQSRNLRC